DEARPPDGSQRTCRPCRLRRRQPRRSDAGDGARVARHLSPVDAGGRAPRRGLPRGGLRHARARRVDRPGIHGGLRAAGAGEGLLRSRRRGQPARTRPCPGPRLGLGAGVGGGVRAGCGAAGGVVHLDQRSQRRPSLAVGTRERGAPEPATARGRGSAGAVLVVHRLLRLPGGAAAVPQVLRPSAVDGLPPPRGGHRPRAGPPGGHAGRRHGQRAAVLPRERPPGPGGPAGAAYGGAGAAARAHQGQGDPGRQLRRDRALGGPAAACRRPLRPLAPDGSARGRGRGDRRLHQVTVSSARV
ncbi:MAG: Oxidoreductase, short-chain dehydrogenase/reductase family, partial [uncultured Nocardioidaceae bacterium]